MSKTYADLKTWVNSLPEFVMSMPVLCKDRHDEFVSVEDFGKLGRENSESVDFLIDDDGFDVENPILKVDNVRRSHD